MTLYLLDTHTVYWHEFNDPKLSIAARRAFEEAEAGKALLILHPIVIVEFYLAAPEVESSEPLRAIPGFHPNKFDLPL